MAKQLKCTSLLRSEGKTYYTMKILVIGKQGSGKSTTIGYLQQYNGVPETSRGTHSNTRKATLSVHTIGQDLYFSAPGLHLCTDSFVHELISLADSDTFDCILYVWRPMRIPGELEKMACKFLAPDTPVILCIAHSPMDSEDEKDLRHAALTDIKKYDLQVSSVFLLPPPAYIKKSDIPAKLQAEILRSSTSSKGIKVSEKGFEELQLDEVPVVTE